MVGCMTESTVGISAIAQLLPLLDYVDMDGAVLLETGYCQRSHAGQGPMSVCRREWHRRAIAARRLGAGFLTLLESSTAKGAVAARVRRKFSRYFWNSAWPNIPTVGSA